MSSIQSVMSCAHLRAGGCLRQRLTLWLAAFVLCAGCRLGHGHPAAAPYLDEDAGMGGSAELQDGAPAQNNRVCTGDASTCREVGCGSAADCKPEACMQAQCVNAQCSYAAVPAGSTCGGGQVCSQGGACGDCVPGTQRCLPGSATMLETCSDSGTWQRSACEGQACFNAQCTGECEPGSASCEADKLRICAVDGRYGAALACATGRCENGACPNECTVSEARCLDLYRMQTCSSVGTWAAITPCGEQRCDLARGSCLDECSPGVNRCAGDMLAQCESDAHWGAAISCPDGCSARGCNSCRPGTQACIDERSSHSCGADGAWQPATPCPLGCQQQHCAVCQAGARRCADAVSQMCAADGSWSERERCSSGCQQDRCNDCVANTAVCPNPQNTALIRLCKPDGTWKPTEGCRAHAHCVGGTGDTCPCDIGYRPSGLAGNPNAGDCVRI